jgi:hypothetical protein
MVCWQKDGDPLNAWNDEITGGGNKPHYVWALTLPPHPHITLLKGESWVWKGDTKVIT